MGIKCVCVPEKQRPKRIETISAQAAETQTNRSYPPSRKFQNSLDVILNLQGTPPPTQMTFKKHSAFISCCPLAYLASHMVIADSAKRMNGYSEQCLRLFLTLTLPGSQKTKCCWSDISITLFPKGFRVHSLLGGMQLLFNSTEQHYTTVGDRMQERQYCTQLRGTREANVNRCNYQMWTLAKEVRANTPLRNATGSLMPESHRNLGITSYSKWETSEALTLCCLIDPALRRGR